MDLFDFFQNICGFNISNTQNTKVIEFCQEMNLIPKETTCQKCLSSMRLGESTTSADQVVWRCPGYIKSDKKKARRCHNLESVRKYTIFAGSKLPIIKILLIMYFWIDNLEINKISKYLNISECSVGRWSLAFREIVFDYFLSNPEPIGGVGSIVEIDESKFGRRKYHRGHHVEGQWVFGGIDRQTGKVFLVPVEKRDQETLIPLIKTWILPHSTIISDCWKAYDILDQERYEHLRVNHSLHFKDLASGAHKNTIESSWRHIKHSLPEYSLKKIHSWLPGKIYVFKQM